MRTRTFMGLVLGLMLVVFLSEQAEAQIGGIFSIGGGSSQVHVGFGSGGFYAQPAYFAGGGYGYGGGYGRGFYVDPHTGNHLSPSNFYGGGGYPVYAIPTQRVYIQDGGYGGSHYHGHYYHH